MTPDAALADLCARYRVPLPFGRRLLPLLRRAHSAPPEQRRFLLELVERSFAREAERRRRDEDKRVDDEDRALVHLAATLHEWDPPLWFKEWIRDLGGEDAFEGDGRGADPAA